MKNKEVIEAWVDNCFAENKNLSSDGRFLRSYGKIIAENRGGLVRITTRKYSVTTSRHANLAEKAAKEVGLPVSFQML